MKNREIMTPFVRCLRPTDTLVDAAEIMRAYDVGAVPVCEDAATLSGFLTDRDIAIRAIAKGLDPHAATVGDAMSPSIIFTFDDDEAQDSAHLMVQYQVRRLPVLDRSKRLVGIVSLADLATREDPGWRRPRCGSFPNPDRHRSSIPPIFRSSRTETQKLNP